jgi:hypothetical protein
MLLVEKSILRLSVDARRTTFGPLRVSAAGGPILDVGGVPPSETGHTRHKPKRFGALASVDAGDVRGVRRQCHLSPSLDHRASVRTPVV